MMNEEVSAPPPRGRARGTSSIISLHSSIINQRGSALISTETLYSARITGTQIQYYFVCHRKLWLFSNHITMEHTNDVVYQGKILGETSYDRKKKELEIDDRVVIDWLDVKEGVLHETKRGPSVEEAHRWQVKYYLRILQEKGIDVRKGIINYPRLKQTEEVALTDEDLVRLQEITTGINAIVQQEHMPDRISKKFCRKCAYYELCWS